MVLESDSRVPVGSSSDIKLVSMLALIYSDGWVVGELGSGLALVVVVLMDE